VPHHSKYDVCNLIRPAIRLADGDGDASSNGASPSVEAGWGDGKRRDAEQTRADSQQTAADADQTLSDGDQTDADREQFASENDEAASHQDQLASDRESSDDADQNDRDRSTKERNSASRLREEQVQARLRSSHAREERAEDRDRVAFERDRVADARDAAGEAQDDAYTPTQRLRRSDDRKRAATDRAHAARDRKRAATDRVRAATERSEATGDRLAAAKDHAKLMASEIDELTGVQRRGSGLARLQLEIARARRAHAPLVVAFVDVNGLKRVNDADGHGAGDALLSAVASGLQRAMRPHDLVLRYGGDEFVCAFPNADLEQVRRRISDVSAALGRAPAHASITAGFVSMTDDDSASALIARADADLVTRRRTV
jgi:diguanylate cyclase (GGDEF)-like protein